MNVLIYTRSFKFSSLFLILFSVICTRIPLLNYLGLEFSVVTVLIAGFVSGILTLALLKQKLFQVKMDLWKFIAELFFVQLVLISIPMLISLANAFFVRNCSLGNGLYLFALIVIPGVIFSSAMAFLIDIVFNRWQKSLFTFLYFIILLHMPIVGLFKPQIFAFNPIVGFFPGFTYDETLQITQRLLIYRIAILGVALCLFACSVWMWNIINRVRNSHSITSSLIEIAILTLIVPAVLMIYIFSDKLGLSSSENFIRQKLAGKYETIHFEIIYPAGSIKRERIEQIGRLHEFYFDEVNNELNVPASEKIITFLYSSAEQKGKLIGAANTDIAKPWLRQIHINISDIEPGLKHEIVHVLASDFGWSPLRIGRNSGLTEGLAMALEGTSTFAEPLDRSVALILAASLKVHVSSLFSFGEFAKAPAIVSYNIAGAFCKYLIDEFGIEKFKGLYNSGSFEEVYEKSLDDLTLEWNKSINIITLTHEDTIKAQYLFRRPSIFGKECARVIANINSDTRELLNRREYEKALALAERSLSLTKTSEAIHRKAGALFEMRMFSQVIEFAEKQLNDSSISYLLLPLRLRLGDAYWALDSIVKTKKQYEYLSAVHLNGWYDEICALRLEALKNANQQAELRRFFINTMEDTMRIAQLEKLNFPLARLILAREYAGKERFADCINELLKISFSSTQSLEYLRLRYLAIAYYSFQEYEQAKEFFIKALNLVLTTSSEINIKEWIRRCEFEKRYFDKVAVH